MPKNRPERIVAAAILQDGVVYTGTRHAFIIRDIITMTGIKPVTGQQGFVTSTGEFVSREIAGEIAMRAGQVTHLKYNHTQLFSEEVWDIPSVPEASQSSLVSDSAVQTLRCEHGNVMDICDTCNGVPPLVSTEAEKPWKLVPVPKFPGTAWIEFESGRMAGSLNEQSAKHIADAHNAAIAREREQAKSAIEHIVETYSPLLGTATSRAQEAERQLAEAKMEFCEHCNTPMTLCGSQDQDCEPSLDCLVCGLRAELVETKRRCARGLCDGAAAFAGTAKAESDWAQTVTRIRAELAAVRKQVGPK